MSETRSDPGRTRATPAEVLVVEGVGGLAIDELGRRYRVDHDADLWRDPHALRSRMAGVRALVVRNRTRVDRRLLESAPDLVVVGRAGAGLDNVDLEAADELGIVVVAAAGGENARSVAELALGLAIALARRIVDGDRDVRTGGWDRTPGMELQGRTWGLIGLGRTGRATGELATALGMDVYGHDPFVAADDPRLAGNQIRLEEADTVLRSADVLSIHVALDASTRGLFDASMLGRMRPGAFLVNVSRGEIVDEVALAAAIRSGHLRGAALDVRATEPSGQEPFEGLDGVILTPHVGGLTEAAQERVASAIVDEIRRVLDGTPARHPAGRASVARV
jgi:D-3-phosphoglycerate dehydrogenase/(S)-sulfolactate dehydrogenase